jgi:phage terminase small subunit
MVLRSPKQAILMQSPYLPIANKAIEQMKTMLLEFGMTPASRSRIDTSKLDRTAGDDDPGILD